MIIWIVLFLFVSFISILLWTPLRLIIDSKKDLYKVEWKYIGSVFLVECNDCMGVQIQVLFFKKIIPFDRIFKKKVKSEDKPQTKKTPSCHTPLAVTNTRSGVFSTYWRSKLKKIMRSFHIKRCQVNWDTDDYILNAYLYPFTPFLYSPQKSFTINFEGKRDIELIIENRLGRILKTFF